MPQRRQSISTGHPWGRTGAADGDTSADRRTERISVGPSRRTSYEPQPLRALLKPILDELQDKLERFEGEPTPEDHRWLRGQLRRYVRGFAVSSAHVFLLPLPQSLSPSPATTMMKSMHGNDANHALDEALA
jgi:hypothetical protein